MKKAALALLLATVATPAIAAQGRLPTDVVPTAYDISVEPNAAAMTFKGTETVNVTVRKATRTVQLNAAELKIARVTFDGRDAPFALNAADQTLTVTLPQAATPGAHVMTFAWDGKINTSAAGFFAIDYSNQDGSKARMLVTQFEAPDARRFAPMWDEPALKARFTLSAVAPAGQTAFSNMPAATVTKRGDGASVYRFQPSPLMSSYLLFLGIGDVERKTVMAGKTEIGIITRRGVVDQGDYALAQAQRLLAYYNDYFGQPYPLPKLDMIAAPGSSQFFSAMENWGAIFYFEPDVLFDPARATQSNRERIYTVVSHEMAHQWFGDLVTMKWWDDLWLNEGFASWMETKTSADLNPSWQAQASAIATDREAALAIDATAATHPIIRPVTTVDELSEAFDKITYQKGEAVIRMIEATLGRDVFRDGIRRYMAAHAYGNTSTDDLWASLSAAAGKPVAAIARDFTLQGGVPLVSVSGSRCAGGATQLSLTQGRFGLDSQSKQPLSWRVPLTVGVVGGGTATTVVQGPTQVNVPGCGTFVLNRGKQGYLRARYDDAGHAALVRDFARLDLADQLGTLGDDFALAVSGDQPLTRYLALQDRIGVGDDPLLWSTVAGHMNDLIVLYRGTPLEPRLRERARVVFTPVLARVGFEAGADESPLVTNLREDAITLLGAAGDATVEAKAREYVARLQRDPNAIPPAIRGAILATYARNATPAEWDVLLKLTLAERNPVAKNAYVRLLGSAEDDALAARALDLVRADTLTAPQRTSLLASVAGRHPDAAFDFAVANRALVDSLIEASARAGYIVGLANNSNDPAMPGKITAFANANLAPASRGGATRAIAFIETRRAAAARLRGDVTAWLGGTGVGKEGGAP